MGAYEALRKWNKALDDAVALQKLGAGSLTPTEMSARIELLQGKKRAKEEDDANQSSDDECGLDLVRMKERFDEVVEKYELRDGNAAEQVSEWLTSGEWLVTIKRVAQRWKM